MGTLYAKIPIFAVSKEPNMINLPQILKIMLLAFPLVFISKAFVQIGQYVKNQRWTNHYEMSAIMNTTNRFRAIDFSTDLVIVFLFIVKYFLELTMVSHL